MAEEKTQGFITAEELAKEFREHSVAEFFKKNKQMLGLYGKVRTLTTIVHEYVTNSLDACEEAKILPEIEVKIDELGEEHYMVTVKDNGPGLTKETVGKALGKLLAGTKFHRMIQARGQQGIGAAGCTMLSQMTTGKPTKVITGTGKGKAISLEISIDPKRNEPKISNMKELDKDYRGLAIQAQFKNVLYREGASGPLEYLKRTAIANPHAQIKFRDPKGTVITFKRTANYIPKQPKEMKPHPYGATVDEVTTMAKYTQAKKISSFLKNDFDRIGQTSIDKIQKLVSFDLNKDPKTLTWEEAEEILKAFKKVDFIAPSTEGLIPIGEERIKKSLQSIVKPEFVHVITRKPKVYAGGFPFQVEVGIAYGGEAGKSASNGEKNEEETAKVEIMRFANRAPLLFDASNCAITKAVNSIDWKRYGVKDFESTPLTIFINFISVHIPYTGAGKQAIADEDEVIEELRLALMDCARTTSNYIYTKRKAEERKMKQEMFYKYIPEIAEALQNITKTDEKLIVKKLEKLVVDKLGLEKLQKKTEEKRVKEKEKEEEVLKMEVKEVLKERKRKGEQND